MAGSWSFLPCMAHMASASKLSLMSNSILVSILKSINVILCILITLILRECYSYLTTISVACFGRMRSKKQAVSET